MREGENMVYKSDNDHNPTVLKTLKAAKRAKDERCYSNYLAGKTWEQLEDRIEWEMPHELKYIEETNREIHDTDPTPLFVDEREDEER